MNLLSDQRIQHELARMRAAASGSANGDVQSWEQWLQARGNTPARLEFSFQEALHPGISGLVWVWRQHGATRVEPVTSRDRFDTNGFAGKLVAEVTLLAALLVAQKLPTYRVAIYAQLQGDAR